jgi:hypothetical protein
MNQQSMSVKRQLCSCDSSVTLLTVSYAWKYCSEWVTVRLGAYLPSANMLRQACVSCSLKWDQWHQATTHFSPL